ncbi:hypothetical protein N7481_005993 [Penicillium waksmanii]|uniref:uncharacterized protein n=1 Tax=Penicillium waksmanii TaxID=69791 RepID=UPI0025489A91|nr:uncharacterized protein N7481_005993 [Penicillium waksmanii]KAJ5983894.1 hypothetical protein N7481_005993 [Penicillium waksmanii]
MANNDCRNPPTDNADPSIPNVTIVATASCYPPNRIDTEDIDDIISASYELSPVLKKTLEINRRSKIQHRYSALPDDHPYWEELKLPSISECDLLFKKYGVPMAEEAANKALQDWGGSLDDITHMVVVTCTNTANPGLDYILSQRLGLHKNVQRTLLHGIGCAGGVAALRTANEFLLGRAAFKKPGRALLVACELTTIFLRTEIADIVRDNQVHIGPTLFGDGAGALILSNGIGIQTVENRSYWKILNVQSTTLQHSARCLEFNVHEHGYHAIISKDVPRHISSSLFTAFQDLIASTPSLNYAKTNFDPCSYDWALHPGGYGILLLAQEALGISEHHLRKSYDVYRMRGNTSSATILSIIKELADEERATGTGRDKVIMAAFGPGITIEMAVMARA